MSTRFGQVIQGLTHPRHERWYSGEIVNLNTDGTYQVWIRELNVVYPRVPRSGPDKRRLSPLDRCVLRQVGIALEIL